MLRPQWNQLQLTQRASGWLLMHHLVHLHILQHLPLGRDFQRIAANHPHSASAGTKVCNASKA